MTTPLTATTRRIEEAKRAWAECYDRLGTKYTDLPQSQEIDDALTEADRASQAYVGGSKTANPREALSRWEALMTQAISTANGHRVCGLCGVERVVVVVNPDGVVVCGRCMRGLKP